MIVRAGAPSAHALALAAVAVLLLGAAAILPLDAPPLQLFACPFRAVTGLPCFGCGSTRAFHFAVRGQLCDALASSPLATLLAGAGGAHALWTCLRLAGVPFALRVENTARARWVAAIALLANWVFVALRARA